MLPYTSAERFGRSSMNDLTRASQPHAFNCPILASCDARKPPLTGKRLAYSASLVSRCQWVNPNDVRSSKMANSAPSSISVDTSGLRSGFPRLLGTRPLPVGEVSAVYVVSLSNAPGWRPARPIAARKRNVDRYFAMKLDRQASLSLGMMDTDACG